VSVFLNRVLFVEKHSEGKKYWPYVLNKWNKNDNLRTMKRVLDRMGYEMVDGMVNSDFDVMWSIEYPFEMNESKKLTLKMEAIMKSLKEHQKINHFPGINFITFKKFMVTNNNFNFIPKSFDLPRMTKEFDNYVAGKPEKKFVTKNGGNRGVKIVDTKEIKSMRIKNDNFFQVFIENPLLIDSVAFDLGVYVLVSSIDPLRIYRHTTEVLLRFCPEPYFPFDTTNIEKYVIYETQKIIFDMPSLADLVDKAGFSFKDSFDIHLRSRGINADKIWAQIDEIIVKLTLSNEKNFIEQTNKFARADHFFELLRFDFIIDDDLVVHLIEVNMSPNLTPADEKFDGHADSYERVVYNTLNMVLGAENYSR
jgi:tubulin monoglycylase TTLL15